MTNQADNGAPVLTPTVEAAVVNALQHECGQTAREHGFTNDWLDADWLEQLANDMDPNDAGRLRHIARVLRTNILGMKLALIHSEISEALESLRENNGAQGALDGEGNFGEELADALVRIMDTGTFTKEALGDKLLNKMAVNKDRPHMHGKAV
jgi:hypothetical protein